MAVAAALLPILAPLLADVIKRAIPDSTAQAEAQAAVNAALLENASKIEEAAGSIIKAEAEGESWLQRNWRPITMLAFVGLIVARWLGFAAPGMSEAEVLAAWSLMEIGLGGYVIARSAEKALPTVAEIIRGMNRAR
jgi:hypothetical protein